MLQLEIREPACRGCRICVDVCPTEALECEGTPPTARVRELADCIACLSCAYACPSGAIVHRDYPRVKNFYRDLGFVRRMERFL